MATYIFLSWLKDIIFILPENVNNFLSEVYLVALFA